MIRAVLFDYGGVLTDAGVKGTLLGAVAEHHKLPFISVKTEQKVDELYMPLRKGLIKADDFFTAIAKHFGDEDNVLNADIFWNLHKDLANRRQEVYDLAEQLRKKGIKTGILSNIFQIAVNRLRPLGAYDGFDPVILSCEVHLAKPEPEIFQLAIKKLNLDPNEILMVDDQNKNINMATQLGMETVLAKSGPQTVRDIKQIIRQENKILLK